MINYLLIIFLLFISSCNNQNHLKINVYNSHFYESNKELINDAIIFIQKHCVTKKPKVLNIKFDYMPIELITISQDKVGMTHHLNDESKMIWIETNIFKFAYQNKEEQKRYILHELGHALRMGHSENLNDIMYYLNSKNKDSITLFQNQIYKFCNTSY